MPPRPGTQESGLLVSLSPDKPGVLSPQLLHGAKVPNPSLLHPRGPGRPSLQPPAAPQPRPSHPLRIPRTGSALWALSFQPLKQEAGEEGGERLLGTPSTAARKWGGHNRSNSSRGRRQQPACPARDLASGHPGPAGPTLRKFSIATPPPPHSASSTPITVPWRVRCLGLICANASLMPDPGNAERKKGMLKEGNAGRGLSSLMSPLQEPRPVWGAGQEDEVP